MIQMLTYDGKTDDFSGENIIIHRFHDAQSLDEFEVNIINLNDQYMWRNRGRNKDKINIIEDIKSLSIMIQHCKNTKILILYPQNVVYRYDYYSGDYQEFSDLKDMLEYLYMILKKLHLLLNNIHLIYENTRTNANGKKLNASFSFAECNDGVSLRSEISQKPTAIILGDDITLSTLNVNNYEEIMCLLLELELIQNKQNSPLWMKEIIMFDDNEQRKIIDANNNTIKLANDNILEAQRKIDKNDEFKSILYTNGNELVKVVFEILETMLGCDLSEFNDEKKEDFLFEIDGFMFIGEIKGVNHNVKSENISQLDVHYQGYLEENEDKSEDQIKALLIINHQRNKPLNIRESVHEQQINLACRNGSLIIETIILLKLFEKYLSGALTREKCLELLKSNVGLFESDATTLIGYRFNL